jgi:hypothetical protein
MTDALTDLDSTVIEALGAHYARGGEAAFQEAASRLVVTASLADGVHCFDQSNQIDQTRRAARVCQRRANRRSSCGLLAVKRNSRCVHDNLDAFCAVSISIDLSGEIDSHSFTVLAYTGPCYRVGAKW